MEENLDSDLQLNFEELLIINEFISEKAKALMKHEGKDFAKITFDQTKFRKVRFGNKIFFIISTPPFSHILYTVLPKACETFPEQFGTRKTETILQAIYETHPFGPFDKYSEFLRTEQFAWILEFQNGNIGERVLRVDLFRKIDQGSNGQSDFTGGIFHAFKHFSFKGIPLSTHAEGNEISYPGHIISMLMEAFCFSDGVQVSETHYTSTTTVNEKYHFKYEFYFEPVTKVYFVETVIKKDNPETSNFSSSNSPDSPPPSV
jgi:hypothetical protein